MAMRRFAVGVSESQNDNFCFDVFFPFLRMHIDYDDDGTLTLNDNQNSSKRARLIVISSKYKQ